MTVTRQYQERQVADWREPTRHLLTRVDVIAAACRAVVTARESARLHYGAVVPTPRVLDTERVLRSLVKSS